MMAAILNPTMLDSAILHKTLTQSNSIWPKLIHSDSTWWWLQSWILPSLIQSFCTKKTSLFNSDSTWWWQPSWILPSSIQPFCTKKNFTHSFWLNLMKEAILNSDILNLAILESAILVFPLKLTHTCQDWFPPFAQIKLHSSILTQLDDGSHLEFCHVGFRHCHLGFRHLVIFSQIHSKTLSLHSGSDWN